MSALPYERVMAVINHWLVAQDRRAAMGDIDDKARGRATRGILLPAGFLRRVVRERLGIAPDEIAAGHCAALSRPGEAANRLEAYSERTTCGEHFGLIRGVRE
jgi:hypothetical protein